MSAKATTPLAALEAKLLHGREGSLIDALDDLGRRIPESRSDVLFPYLDQLQGLRFDGHPWARLAVGYAMQFDDRDDDAVEAFYSADLAGISANEGPEGSHTDSLLPRPPSADPRRSPRSRRLVETVP